MLHFLWSTAAQLNMLHFLCRIVVYLHTCLKTPGNFLNFLTETGLVDELRLCFKDDSFFSKECGIVITTIVWKHDSSVSLGFKTIYIYIFPIFMMFATQKEGYCNYCLWEVHNLNLSTVILHFILHTYSVAANASKWRYLLFPLLGWNFFLEFATFWT